MKTFKEWLKETYAIYDPKVKPKTFNWWGDPKSSEKLKKKKPYQRP